VTVREVATRGISQGGGEIRQRAEKAHPARLNPRACNR
jgi:hypothetical protein